MNVLCDTGHTDRASRFVLFHVPVSNHSMAKLPPK